MIKALLLSSLVLNIGLLLGRLSGFAREAFIATSFGASAEADIVVIMLTVPDLLVNILVGGAMGAVLIPEFTRHPEKARTLLYQCMVIFGSLFLFIAAAIYVLNTLVADLLAPGFSGDQAAQAAISIGWVIWLVPLTVLAGVTTAYLHSRNKFAVASMGTLIINSSIIVGLILVYLGLGSLWLVAIFALLGGVLRLASQLSCIRPSWKPISALRPLQLDWHFLKRYGQVMLSGSLLLLFPVIARALASYEGEGSLAIFNYSMRLIEFPLVIAVTFVTTAFYPRLSSSLSSDLALHKQLVKYGFQITLGLSVIAAIILKMTSNSYASIVYGYGDMHYADTELVATLAAIGLLALPVQGLSVFLTSIFHSRKDTRSPLLINGAGLIFFATASYYGLLGDGLAGLMMRLVASYIVICVLMLIFVSKESFTLRSAIFEREFVLGLVASILISVLMTGWIEPVSTKNWIVMLLAFMVGLFALSVMAIFNGTVRSKLAARLNS